MSDSEDYFAEEKKAAKKDKVKKADKGDKKEKKTKKAKPSHGSDDDNAEAMPTHRPRTRSMDIAEEVDAVLTTGGSSKKDAKVSRKRARSEDSAAQDSDDESKQAAQKPRKVRKGDDSGDVGAGAAGGAGAAAALDPDAPDAKGNPPLSAFKLSPDTAAALRARGITHFFPIQAQSFNQLLSGRDMIGRARTGSGKTLAFALPIIEKLKAQGHDARKNGRLPKVLALAPTRELAKQVAEDFATCAPWLTTTCVYGGVGFEQQKGSLWRGTDVVVGTTGRILDLMSTSTLKLTDLQFLVLDEADRMLDMGFSEDVDKICNSIPSLAAFAAASTGGGSGSSSSSAAAAGPRTKTVQTIMFSATIASWVRDVSRKYMSNPLTVDLVEGEVASVDVQHLVVQCPWQVRAATIADLVRMYGGLDGRTIIFVETKKEADELAVNPALTAHVECKAMHGDVAQAARESTLAAFKKGGIRCIVATDVAARGLDIKGVDLVIQTQPPCGKFSGRAEIDTYVHRSGRTGRAGAKGTCITLFTRQQESLIKDIERATGNTFTRIGTPQPADMVRVSGEQASTKLGSVHEEQVDVFRPVAEKLIKKALKDGDDAASVIARALAVISGFTSPLPVRSLLSASEGYMTFAFNYSGSELRSPAGVWAGLRGVLPQALLDDIRGMTLFQDGTGAVFDVPEKHVAAFKEAAAAEGSPLSVAKDLPELKANPGGSGGGGGYGGGGGGFGGRGGGGFGGRGGGFGGRGGGFGGRGGGFGGGRGGGFGGRGGFRR